MNHDFRRFLIGEFVSIYQRGRRQIWTAEFRADGKHCRKSLRTSNLKIARPRAAAIDRQLAKGVYISTSNLKQTEKTTGLTIREAIDRYISHCETNGCRSKTRTKYRGILVKFAEFAGTKGIVQLVGADLTLVDAFRKLRKPQISPKSLHHDGSTLKRFFDWAMQRKHIAENPLAGETFTPPEPKEKSVLTLEQVDAILRAAPERLYAPLAVLAFTGARSGEVQRLLAGDIDFDGNWIRIESRPGAETKSGRSRQVPIHPRLRAVLDNLPKKSNGYRFTAEPSKRYPDGSHYINVKRLNESFQVILKGLKIATGRDNGFSVHSLRHFMRTSAINAGVPERAADVWLGHEHDRRSVQAIYFHLSDHESQRFMTMIPFGDGKPAADAGEFGGAL